MTSLDAALDVLAWAEAHPEGADMQLGISKDWVSVAFVRTEDEAQRLRMLIPWRGSRPAFKVHSNEPIVAANGVAWGSTQVAVIYTVGQ